MSNTNLIEISALVNLPSCCLNRDEAGQPKECMFSGFSRALVSSQAVKFAMRTSDEFKGICGNIGKSIRTAQIYKYVIDRLNITDEDMISCVCHLCDTLGQKGQKSLIKWDKESNTFDLSEVEKDVKKEMKSRKFKIPSINEKRSTQIMIFSPSLLDFLVETIECFINVCNGDVNKFAYFTNQNIFDLIKGKRIEFVTLDTALFGSMTASALSSNIPASMHVAKMVSTNTIVHEDDFFIAADDFVIENPDKMQGAANLGNIPYNSSCMYKYACIDLDILKSNLSSVENLDEVLKEIIPELVRLFSITLPKGKQTTNAAYVLPDFIMVTLKGKKIPSNLVNAFAKPIVATKTKTLSENSIESLVNETNIIDSMYNLDIQHRYILNLRSDLTPKNGEKVSDLNELLENLKNIL